MPLCGSCNVSREFYKGSNCCKSCDNKRRSGRQIELKIRAITYKGGKCTRCGYDQHYAALTFHHLRDKEMVWNQMRSLTWEKVKSELDKCELLCVNCHYIEHAKE